MKSKYYLFIILFIASKFYSRAQDSFSVYKVSEIDIFYTGPIVSAIAPPAPEQMIEASFKLTIKPWGAIRDVIDEMTNVFIVNSNKEKTGNLFKKQMLYPYGILLIKFHFYSNKDSINTFSLFMNIDGYYLIDNSEEENKPEKSFILFLQKYFYAIGKDFEIPEK